MAFLRDVEKQRIRAKDERVSYNRTLKEVAHWDSMLELMKDTIQRADPIRLSSRTKRSRQCVYAMLSDIHYGIAFQSSCGTYNSDVAKERVMRYAEEIIHIGEMNHANICYLSLMGDMISGNIHTVIRIENRENVVEQVVGVSELVAAFIYRLACCFDEVHVNAVDGNHSRVELHDDEAMRADKLDSIVPWYCKVKLENCDNVFFHENDIDATVASFEIAGRMYCAVHGDYDKDLKLAAQRIERLIRRKVDYMLAGHMHVPDVRIEDIGCIRNGSVCGSGDEYTMKKRLFAPPQQLCMLVSDRGVEALYPINLMEDDVSWTC